MGGSQKTIALVDDHALFREGLRYIIEHEGYYTILFEASNGKDLLEKLQETQPDIVLMDIEMPQMNGIEATKQALEKFPNLRILILSMFSDQQYYHAMIEAGAHGFILKDSGKNELERAIDDVASGESYFSQKLLRNIIAHVPEKNSSKLKLIDPISNRELDVLKLVCEGLSNNEISEKLHISPKTVEGHKAKLMSKTNTRNTVSLVMFTIKNKLIQV
jgi:DNA-binding NarL/FixJ family response regulator